MTSAETTRKLFDKLDNIETGVNEANTAIAVLQTQMDHKVEESDMLIAIADSKKEALAAHRDACPLQREATGVQPLSSPAKETPTVGTGTINISISGLSKFWRWFLYAAVPAATAAAGAWVNR